MIKIADTNVVLTDNNTFLFSRDKELTAQDVLDFIQVHKSELAPKYKQWKDEYKGKHPILDKSKTGDSRPDNRLVVNIPHYLVETMNGYFIGVPPKITLDNTSDNQKLQDWNDTNSFQDKLSEISRQINIFGRSIAFAYQNEDSQTEIAYVSPESAFIIYDDSVAMKPIAFVRYFYQNNKLTGEVWDETSQYVLSEEFKMEDGMVNQFNMVPAVEFFSNEDRQGLIEPAQSLFDALDKAMSQKANQVEYFDNSYLKMLGLTLPKDKDGNPILNIDNQRVIYSEDADSTTADVDFIAKPDGDNMQEHLIQRVIDMIYQNSMVANLNDDAFSGNASGVAIKYKLMPMSNLAMNQERKFTQSLRKLYQIIFSVGTILSTNQSDAWKDLSFQFKRNIPVNLADEAATAQSLTGIVSKETQLSTLDIVDDPKAEIQRMTDEQSDLIKNAQNASDSLVDSDKDK